MTKGSYGCPLSFLVAQQNDQRAFAAIGRLGLAIGQHFLALGQPAAYQLAQDGGFLRRTEPLAMHDPDTTLAVMQAFSQKTGEQLPGFIPVQAVQVDFILNYPASAAQIAQDILGQSGAQIMRLVTALEAILQADVAVQAFVQGGLFVGKMLERAGWRWPFAVHDEVGRGEWLDAAHRSTEFGLDRIEFGWRLCFGGSAPVRRQSFLARFFAFGGLFFAGRWSGWGFRFRFVQLNAIDRRQWLDVGHFRLEGSKVFRVDQIQASASR